MGRKSKTRVFVEIDRAPVELFSIRERSNGELNITQRVPDTVVLTEDDKRLIHEQHMSVHRTNDSRDTTITFKQLFTDGSQISDVAHIHNTCSYLLWPLFGNQVGVSDATFMRSPPDRARDSLISIGAYQSKMATLYYTVFICRHDLLLPVPLGAKAHWIKLRDFTILVLSGFINIPSPKRGNLAGITTSTRVKNGVKSREHVQITRSSIKPSEFYNVHLMLLERLRALMMVYLNNMFSNLNNGKPNDLDELASFFTPEPIVPSP